MRRSRWFLDLWSLVLSVVVVGPLMWRSGLPVARDAVFAPDPPWTWQLAGLGGAAPRAVPVDALVTLGTHLAGADVIARFAVLGPMVLAGCAAHRLLAGHGPVARVLVASLAILNPLTVERLALGQWALLWTWGALWAYVAVWRRRRDAGGRLAVLVLIAALGSLTPTGGALMLAVVTVTATIDRRPRRWWVVAGTAVLQAPWVVAGFVGGSSIAIDPRSFRVFAFHDEVGWASPWGELVTVLSLGGVWDTTSVPGSREGLLVVVASVVWTLLAILGLRSLRTVERSLVDRWALLAVAGVVVALAPTVPWGRDLLGELGSVVPGMGLLRDSQKWILPFGVLWVVAGAAGASALARRVRDPGTTAMLCLVAGLAPWWMLPDGPAMVHRTLQPVTYPDGFARAAEVVADGGPGDLVTVPWRSYRVFDWATPAATYDPASRWFERGVLTQDRLVVDDVVLTGESPRSAVLTPLLTAERIDGDAVAAEGVRWIVVYADDPEADGLTIDGVTLRLADDVLRVYEVDGDVDLVEAPAVWPSVLAAGAASGVVVAALVGAIATRRNRPAEDSTRPVTSC